MSDEKGSSLPFNEISEKYHKLISLTGTGFCIVSFEGLVLDANEAYKRLTGREKMNDVLGHSITEFIAPYDRERNKMEFEKCIESGSVINLEIDYLTPSKVSIPLEIFANVAKHEGKDAVFALLRDISVRKKEEENLRRIAQELESAVAAAKSANMAKSRFLANMSHEIRTPLTAIIGFSDLMKSQNLSPNQCAEWANIVSRNGEHLMELINNILDLSKIESGKMDFDYSDFSVVEAINQVHVLLKPKSASKHLDFKFKIDSDFPESITSFPMALRQVLLNLLGNAIKFTESGSIFLHARRVRGVDGDVLQFDVVDTGKGMSAEQIASCIEPFEQCDVNISREFGGTGLGLALTKSILNQIGGELTMTSKQGKGSHFTFTLPFAEILDDQKDLGLVKVVPTQKARIPLRILVAEDTEETRQFFEIFLSKEGHFVNAVKNGKEAVAAVNDGSLTPPFDLVLMDIQMPVLDGYGATKELRKIGYDGPIVAVTAHALDGTKAKCMESGFSGYLSKPIQLGRLQSVLETASNRGVRG